MTNQIKNKFLSGERTLGTFFESGSSTIMECLGLAGMDYAIIDSEHGPFNPQTSLEYIRTAKLYGVTPFARVQEISRPAILKLLDAGAMGLIIPNVGSLEDAQRIVEFGKYMPIGCRGVSASAGTSFWEEDYAKHGLQNYFDISNSETLLIPQCETLGCLNDLERILALPGVDGIFSGPFDLSSAMGIPGEFSNPKLLDALRHIALECKKAGKLSIIFASTEEMAVQWFEMGYDSVTYSMDAAMLIKTARDVKSRLLP